VHPPCFHCCIHYLLSKFRWNRFKAFRCWFCRRWRNSTGFRNIIWRKLNILKLMDHC